MAELGPGARARAIAAGIVRDIGVGRSLSEALPAGLGLVLEADRPLVQELCFGVARWYPRLGAILDGLLARPLKARDADLRALLLVGLYQLIYTRIVPHAAVAETVDAARDLGKPWASGLINGVLRTFLREREAQVARADRGLDGRFAHPLWLVERIRQAWPGRWESVLSACNERPPMTLRVNQLRVSRDEYRCELERLGLKSRLPQASPVALELQEAVPVQRLPGFQDGVVSVQDAGAQLAAALLDLRPGQRVLDVCAAPGGKTGHILETEPALQEVVAVDIDGPRLARVRENLDRLGLSAVLYLGDAARPAGSWARPGYDRILLDAPCSATGVMRRHPDIKLLRRSADIAALAATQARMLAAVWSLLEPGGILLYATCSLIPEENEQQVDRFLRATADAREMPIQAPWGQVRTVGRQTLPGDDGMDGFYYACLQKV